MKNEDNNNDDSFENADNMIAEEFSDNECTPLPYLPQSTKMKNNSLLTRVNHLMLAQW